MSKKIVNAAAANREAWFIAALPLLQEQVFGPAGLTIPADVKVSCSWPGGGSARKRIGECWPRAMSAAKINELFISPLIAEPIPALDILSHELIHAIDDCKHGHKAPFRKMATAIGLTGKMTATVAGPELRAKLEGIADQLGQYPHAKLDLSSRKKQTTRNIKCVCTDEDCGAVFRMTQSWIDRANIDLTCPVCHAAAQPEG
jgi:hypothetical protein